MFLGAGPFVAFLLSVAAVVVIFSSVYERFFAANYPTPSLGVLVLAFGQIIVALFVWLAAFWSAYSLSR